MIRSTTKPTKWPVRPAKTQISLGIHPVWSESSLLSARFWSDWADAQADLSLRRAHVILLVLSCGGSYVLCIADENNVLFFISGAMSLLQDLPDYYQPLSLKVYQVLEDIGVNTEMRQLWMDKSITREILWNACVQPSMTSYTFGSSYEGTTTPGMRSDSDHVIVLNDLPVVTDPADHPVGNCLLLVQDQTTPPGYCKLQLVHNGIPLYGNNTGIINDISPRLKELLTFCLDKNNRLVCSFTPLGLALHHLRRQGPALTRDESGDIAGRDNVFALQCSSWPACGTEWLHRNRPFEWPTNEMIDKCKRLGCIFVGVGHPNSDEQHLMWRISYSHQERMFVTDFNSVQLKCYGLLKIIKKEIIAFHIPQSLTSYHLKTCMLFLKEATPVSFWRPDNLLGCVTISLKVLLQWTEKGTCQNYFIPAENMFDRHVHGETKLRLHQILQHLLDSDCKFLADIKSDNIGNLLQVHCASSSTAVAKLVHQLRVKKCQQKNKLQLQAAQVAIPFSHARTFIMRIDANVDTPLESLQRLDTPLDSFQRQLLKLKTNRIDTGHTQEQMKPVLQLMSPYIELSLMSILIAAEIKQGKQSEEIWPLLASDKWNELCAQSDSFSSKLKQASLMYSLGFYHSSLDILSTLAGLDRFTDCRCYDDRLVDPIVNGLPESIPGYSCTTVEDLLKKYIIPCVYYLPLEKSVTPTALCYEMIRTVGQERAVGIDFIRTDTCYSDWAFVDGHFLLHFLLYLNHSKLNMDIHASGDTDNMEMLLNTRVISHRETCLNLLGWVYKEQGDIVRAMECFKKSIEVKPYWNAALWHIALLCFESIACKQPWQWKCC